MNEETLVQILAVLRRISAKLDPIVREAEIARTRRETSARLVRELAENLPAAILGLRRPSDFGFPDPEPDAKVVAPPFVELEGGGS